MKLDILRALNAERAARRAAVVVTDMANGEQRLVKAADVARDPLREVIEKHIRRGKSGMAETPAGKVFLTVHVPPSQLVITGAVHISQALAPIARLLGYDVTIVDPRTAFASIERFPDVKVIAEWPDVALPPLGIDRYTAFVALTHDPKIDDPALTHALARDCFYIGALGSKKTHGRRVERLKAQGLSDASLAVHSIRQSGLVLKKGTLIGKAEIAALKAAGIAEIVVARIEPGDVSEDAAAAEIAATVAGEGVHVERAFTGRATLFAETAGVLVVDTDAIDRLNQVDESITFATLPAYKPVVAGEMIATVKIIPFAVAGNERDAALAVATAARPLVRIAPYRIRKIGVVSTLLPGLAGKVIEKTLKVTEERLAPARASIVE